MEFTFTVTLSDTTISKKYGDMTFTNGVATVTLKGGEKATATGLPTGITYTITEADAEGFELTDQTGDTGTISTTKSEAEFTNSREKGGLELSKVLVSDLAADADVEFTFTVTLSDTTISKKYGDMTFANGVATVTLKGGEKATATDLPTGITYTITEAAATGFQLTGKTGDTGTISTTKSEAEFENTRDTGDLTVKKTVSSTVGSDTDKDFTFTVTLTGLSSEASNKKYGDMQFANGVATFTLKDGETATATGLPAGVQYTVEETDAANFTTTYDGKESGTISTTAASTTVTNTRDTGSLEVSKTVVSNTAADHTKVFTFTITMADNTVNGTFSGVKFENGTATIELKDTESKLIEGLPAGIDYTVTEAAEDGFAVTKNGDTGTISSTAVSEAEFTNTRNEGGLTVSKTLVSDLAADTDKEFTITVTLKDTSINGKYGDATFANGVATLTLKGGGSANITGLPAGIGYTVEEAAADGFVVTYTGETGTIETGKTAAAEVTNTRETGDLELSKVLVSDRAADADVTFTFTVTLSDTTITGTYGDMEFENGVATVTLKGGENVAAEGLPTTVTYEITEADAAGFKLTGKTGDTGTITTTPSEAEFENTRDTGSLKLSKVVVSDLAADADAEFTFTITFTGLADDALNKAYKATGAVESVTLANGVATVTLKGGQSVTITGLPTEVDYEITEAEAEGFTTEPEDGATGTIKTTLSEEEFTNTREKGDLEVTKTVVSDLAADADKEFSFTVTLADETINGTYGDMTFENGVATVTLKGGQKAVAEGLPTDLDYTVEEAAADGFTTSSTGETGTISTEKSKAAFTNTREVGDLTVSKTVVSDLAADADKEFTFTVTLKDKTISGTYGDMTFTDGVATVTLKGGESATAKGLPTTLEYTVEEAEATGFTTASEGVNGTISKDKAGEAKFTNTREVGDLKVSKVVVSDLAADADKEFTFTVTLKDKTISGTYGDMTFTDGVATVTLKGGESATAKGLPTTLEYTVEEAEADGFTTESEGEEGAIVKDKVGEAKFTNTREKGDLEVTKTVVSDLAADANKEFNFTVTLADETINGKYGDMTFENGVATVTLKGGESATAKGLPTTLEYTVEEAEADGFITDSEGEEGAIKKAEVSKAAFTNTREKGDLQVTKTVVSDFREDTDVRFTFTVTLADDTISGSYGEMEFNAGVATFDLKGGESKKAEGLPTTLEYTVEEKANNAFETTMTGNTGAIEKDKAGVAAFTNTRKVVEVPVEKVWSDQNDKYGVRPESITVVLLADGAPCVDQDDNEITAILSEENEWKTVFEGLPEVVKGSTVKYTVEEVMEDENGEPLFPGYTVEITDTADSGYTITNTFKPVDTDPPVGKIVIGDKPAKPQTFKFTFKATSSDPEPPMPEKTEIEIVGEGMEEFGQFWFTEPGTYEYEIAEVKENAEGYTYDATVYKLKYEITVGKDNELVKKMFVNGKEVEDFEQDTIQFENKYTMPKVELTVTKEWVDNDDELSLRPASIKVEVMGNKEVVKTVLLTEMDGWTKTIKNLPKYDDDGKEIKYTVKEAKVSGYDCEVGKVSGNADDGYEVTITNTFDVPPVDKVITVKKNVENGPKKVSTYKFELTVVGTAPEPDGVNNGTFTIKGDGSTQLKFSFDEPGTYTYKLKEVNTGEKDCTYDKAEYKLVFKVTLNTKTNKLDVKLDITNGKKTVEGTKVTFTNSYLVKTGDDTNMTPWVVAMATSATIAGTGVVVIKKRRKEEEEA